MSVHIKPMRSLSNFTLGTVELITGGLLLTAAGLGMVGPLTAALLIHRSAPAHPNAVLPLILLAIAASLALLTGLALFALAHHRRN
ncbi:hypothetical protein [Nocardia sp. NPDC058666]|uniref:hypothetical protein n=1 Tax=Nocardia sp. NPDC058666 TaxID=3346587 RepID=UPI0036546B60